MIENCPLQTKTNVIVKWMTTSENKDFRDNDF